MSPEPSYIDSCQCCIHKVEIQVLLTTPLRDPHWDCFVRYSPSLFLIVGDVEDFRYFLPHILEIASQDEDYYPSPEVLLSKLKLDESLTTNAHLCKMAQI